MQDMGHSLCASICNYFFLQPYCIELEPAAIVLSGELQTAVQVRKPLQVHILTSVYFSRCIYM